MYLLLVYNTIFHPFRTSRRIFCQHPNLKEHMINGGTDKYYWCVDCGMSGVGAGLKI